MNASVNPWVAALIIALAVGIFAVKFRADDLHAHVPSPGLVRATPDGGLWLVMGNELFRFGADGQQQAIIPLVALHVTDLLGDIGVFQNGDLLLRAEPAAGDTAFAAGQLLRCEPLARQCRRWSDLVLNKVFRLHIDAGDTVFIADTMHHRLLRRAADGRDQGTVYDGVRYPNQLWREGNRLYATMSDGGSQAMRWFAIGKDTLGDKTGSADIGHAPGVAAGQVMASDILRVGGAWWVNLMHTGQRDGGIYRFDDHWNLLGRLVLPVGADPLVMALYQDTVVLTDFGSRRIFRFAADGTPLPDITSPDVQDRLAHWRADERFYHQLSLACLLAFAVLLLAGFVAAFWQLKTVVLPVTAPTLAEQSVSVDDPAIQWLDVDPSSRRQNRWAVALMTIGLGMLLFTLQLSGIRKIGWPLVVMIPLIVVVVWLQMRQLRQRIGVRGSMLVLRDGRGRTAVGQGERILYSDNHIVIDDVAVMTGNGLKSLFPKERLVQEVFPLLKTGRYLKPAEMQQWLFRHSDPVVILPVLLILAILLVFIAGQLGWLGALFP